MLISQALSYKNINTLASLDSLSNFEISIFFLCWHILPKTGFIFDWKDEQILHCFFLKFHSFFSTIYADVDGRVDFQKSFHPNSHPKYKVRLHFYSAIAKRFFMKLWVFSLASPLPSYCLAKCFHSLPSAEYWWSIIFLVPFFKVNFLNSIVYLIALAIVTKLCKS